MSQALGQGYGISLKAGGETGEKMSKNKSIKTQIQHAVAESNAFGQSRHAAKNGGDNLDWKIHSKVYSADLWITAGALGTYIQDKYPNVKKAALIEPYMLQGFIQDRATSGCNVNTLEKLISQVNKLDKCVQHTYKVHTRWHPNLLYMPKDVDTTKQRDIVMPQKVADRILEVMPKTTETWKAVVLSKHAGLRIGECARIHKECFHLNSGGMFGYGYIEIRRGAIDGAKHGRPRTIHILSQNDQTALREVLHGVKVGETVIRQKDGTPYAPGSIDRAIDRAIKKAGFDKETLENLKQNKNHALRKGYAQRAYDIVRRQTDGQGDSKRMAADFASQQLGHGKNRNDVLAVYVGIRW